MNLTTRISADPTIMGGVPCVKGTRIPVATVLRCVRAGMSPEQIIADHPSLKREDVDACLEFAIAMVQDRFIPLRPTGS